MPIHPTKLLKTLALFDSPLRDNAQANINPAIFPWVKKLWFAMYVLTQYGRLSYFCDKNKPGDINMGTLRTYDISQVKTLVTTAWVQVVEQVISSKIIPVSQTFDPISEDSQALVSSKNHKQAFHKFKVAFRSDTRPPSDITASGMQALYQLPKDKLNQIMLALPNFDEYIADTPVTQGMCINKQNQDFFNETGVCVSRTLQGATKFPTPGDPRVSYIYAVGVDNCLDTEAYQRLKGGTAPWRPGEKAVKIIPPSKILAHTSFIHSDYNEGADGRDQMWFKYTITAPWTYTQHITSDQKSYISGELDGKINVKQTYLRGEDFVVL
ncbi:hypothetical protein [Methylomonas rosea]|uniref:Uncharacterized protein n=1 Tax=Methylomonas rosea TaxID=2952227 RepID=A0ABT1TSZ3_9GAMM|nr:hypothetical protein [Methylomonas sp. WSC-7]MCQ8117896.1 hypothetical protein [Methylomonas sp. WSC-7]